MPPPLFTIGYEGTAMADFLATLTAAGVDHLIDVRDAPVSRRQGFSKNALAEALAEAGIGYTHLKGLGNPKEGREAARAGDHARYRAILDARLASPEGEAALAQAAALTRAQAVCLMCYERDPAHCHRLIVAHRLADMTGQTDRHLRVRSGLAAEKLKNFDLFASPSNRTGN